MSNTDLTSNTPSILEQRDRLSIVQRLIDLLLSSNLIVGDSVHEPHEAAAGAFFLLMHLKGEISAVESALGQIGRERATATA